MFANSRRVERATCTHLTDNIYVVRWKGGDYSIQKTGNTWKIRRRGGPIPPIAVIEERYGFGKEEAIDWIEENV